MFKASVTGLSLKTAFLQVPGLADMNGRERQKGGEVQDMELSSGKAAHAGDKSGAAEGPGIAPCPVIAVGKGKREAGQEKYEGGP